MKRPGLVCAGVLAAASMLLTACGGGGSTADPNTPATITLAGWSLATTPEFRVLADAFHAEYPQYQVELREYDATNYDTQMVADLAAGTAPDVFVQKNLRNFTTYQSGEQLLDVSDVAAQVPDAEGLDTYQVDGATYAVPYRQDSWYLFYNRDLFDAAGVAYPDGTWTWEDYDAAAVQLTQSLQASGSPALGTYQHVWQSVVQGFALAQTPGADLLSGDYSYLAPYYERALALQDDGAAVPFGTATTNSLTYQSQFGTQQAAMLPMGSWYAATLITQQQSGDADSFTWGMAPAPQLSEPTTGEPVSFADPTGLGINAAIDDERLAAAQAFLAFAAGEGGATALAEIGITPATITDQVTQTYFAVEGMPNDELTQRAFTARETRPENPVSPRTATIQNILKDAHSAIMSGSSSIQDALTLASERVRSEAPAE